MKALHAVLVCLIILAVFNYTTATLRPLIQHENNLPKEKTTLHNSREVSPKEKAGAIIFGDPIDDPRPRCK